MLTSCVQPMVSGVVKVWGQRMATVRRQTGETVSATGAASNKRRARPSAPDAVAPAERDPVADAEEDTTPQHGELLRRARDVLAVRGESLPAGELAAAVFGLSGGINLPGLVTPWAPMLERLLRPSPHFVCDEQGCWRLTAWDTAHQSLADVEFVVLDVETTGLAPGRHRLIEVGAVIVRGGEQIAIFRKLINPQRHIPQFITQFTGISERMVARAAAAGDVLPALREFIGARPIVGHNVGFDLGFLNYEADRCGMSGAFPIEGIDTIGLARRYLTGLRRAKLDYVAAALHIPVHTRHRALPDAQLTASIFAHLLARAREADCETLEDLRRVLAGLGSLKASVSG
ncbi:MAG: 3'-5' exonuclease, partial [Ktedonobacterales bacterium]